MPNIREYQAPEGMGIQPTEIGIDATAGAARRVGAFYNQAAGALAATGQRFGSAIRDAGDVAVKYVDHQQISQGAPALAGLIAKNEQKWNDAAKNADPNDPTVGPKFLEGMEGDLEKFKDSFWSEGAQKWAEAHVDQFRSHMFNKTSADMSTMAGQAAVVNAHQTINSLSVAAMNDPSSKDFLLKTLDGTTEGLVGSSPTLSGTEASAVRTRISEAGKEAIVKAAAFGEIQKTGKLPEWTSDPKYSKYINGMELKQLEKAAQTQQKVDLLTQKQLEDYQQKQQTRAADAALSKNWTDNVSFDENGKATIKPEYFKNITQTEMNYPGVVTPRSEQMIKFGQEQQKEKRDTIITDKPTLSSLYDGFFREDKPTTDVDILKARVKGLIDDPMTSRLLQMSKALEEAPLKGPIYRDTLEAVKGSLGDSEKGHMNYANFLQAFIPEYLKQQRAGTLPPNALDMRDPQSLISQSLAPWKLTPQEKMMGHIMKNLGGGGNLTGDGNFITGIEVKDAPLPPAPGTTKNGYRFKGGNPAQRENWEKVN